MNILRKCQNQNQVKEIENGQQPAPRSLQNSYSDFGELDILVGIPRFKILCDNNFIGDCLWCMHL